MPCVQPQQEDVTRCVDRLLRSRRSVRAFLPDPISPTDAREILEAAATAPSNSNTQPWQVHVLKGKPKHDLAQALVGAFHENVLPASQHFPDPMPEVFGARQADFAGTYYATLGIDRGDMAARTRQTLRNFSFFDAPIGLVFTIDARLRPHSWLDLGLFVQNVMLAAKARGIATCPQVSFARFHAVIARQLSIPCEQVTVCGMAMGYADPQAPVNTMPMPRVSVDGFASWAGFED